MNDKNNSLDFKIGEMHSDIKWIRKTLESHADTNDNHETRLVSLEQTRFRAFTIVGVVGGALGLFISYIKDGIEWLTNHLT